MSNCWPSLVAILVAYLIGAIPFGLLVSRARGVDIRAVGSGNIGATNVFRCVGKSWGLLVFALDFLKGLSSALWVPLIVTLADHEPSALLGVLCSVGAVAGHNWPIYLRFKGGKGIATTAGVLLGFAPLSVAIGLVSWIIVFLLSRYVSLASLVAALIIATSAWWLYDTAPPVYPVALTLLAILAFWRHRTNIQRLLAGTENRFDFKRKKG